MKVMFLNNEGFGFAGEKEIDNEMTVSQFFVQQMGEVARAENYTIKVNRLPATPEQKLCENDRVSFIPAKIEGAIN